MESPKFLFVMHFSYIVLFHRKKTKKKHKKSVKPVIENLFLLFEVIACEHVGTQSPLAREHINTQSTLSRKHVSVRQWARTHVSTLAFFYLIRFNEEILNGKLNFLCSVGRSLNGYYDKLYTIKSFEFCLSRTLSYFQVANKRWSVIYIYIWY